MQREDAVFIAANLTTGEEIRIFKDGTVEGMPPGFSVTINKYPTLLKTERAGMVIDRNGLREAKPGEMETLSDIFSAVVYG